MDQRTFIALAAGALINSSLYVAGVFIASVIEGNQVAMMLALATAGLNFLSYTFQMSIDPLSEDGRLVSIGLVAISIFLGIAAGFALIVW